MEEHCGGESVSQSPDKSFLTFLDQKREVAASPKLHYLLCRTLRDRRVGCSGRHSFSGRRGPQQFAPGRIEFRLHRPPALPINDAGVEDPIVDLDCSNVVTEDIDLLFELVHRHCTLGEVR